MKKFLLSTSAALALVAISAAANAGERHGPEFGTKALSLGLGFGNVYADTYGSTANAKTTNTYTSSAKASITPPEEEECETVCEVSRNSKYQRPVVATEAHATAKNEFLHTCEGLCGCKGAWLLARRRLGRHYRVIRQI